MGKGWYQNSEKRFSHLGHGQRIGEEAGHNFLAFTSLPCIQGFFELLRVEGKNCTHKSLLARGNCYFHSLTEGIRYIQLTIYIYPFIVTRKFQPLIINSSFKNITGWCWVIVFSDGAVIEESGDRITNAIDTNAILMKSTNNISGTRHILLYRSKTSVVGFLQRNLFKNYLW